MAMRNYSSEIGGEWVHIRIGERPPAWNVAQVAGDGGAAAPLDHLVATRFRKEVCWIDSQFFERRRSAMERTDVLIKYDPFGP